MATTLATYVVNDEVRAVLGTNVDELSDTTLNLPMYLRGLQIELTNQIGPNILSDFATAQQSSTLAATNLVMGVQQYALYHVAYLASDALPMFSPQDISDGKTAINRFSSAYKTTLAAIEERMNHYKEWLVDAYLVYQGITVPTLQVFMPLASAQPSYDPVTGV